MSAAPEEMEQVAMFKLPRMEEERFTLTSTRKLPANVDLSSYFAKDEDGVLVYEEVTVTGTFVAILKGFDVNRIGNDSGLLSRQVRTWSMEATSLEITEVGHAGPPVVVIGTS